MENKITFPAIASFFMLLVYLFLIFLGVKFVGNLILGAKTTISPSPTPTLLPTQPPTLTPTASQKTYCKSPRPEACTEECLLPPPYLCGSNGKSYCTKCQACADKQVEWYQFQDEPCTDTSSGPHPIGDAASEKECLEKGGRWGQWGLLPQEYCQIPSQDAGKSCTDGSQCEYGLCMNREQSAQGVCATYRQEFGCYSTIVNNQPGPAICVD